METYGLSTEYFLYHYNTLRPLASHSVYEFLTIVNPRVYYVLGGQANISGDHQSSGIAEQ
jgi:hypothetical protein